MASGAGIFRPRETNIHPDNNMIIGVKKFQFSAMTRMHCIKFSDFDVLVEQIKVKKYG